MGFLDSWFGKKGGMATDGSAAPQGQTSAPKIRINPTSSLNEDERKLLAYIGLTLQLTYPFHDEAKFIEELQEQYGIDRSTADYYLRQSISAMKASGGLKG